MTNSIDEIKCDPLQEAEDSSLPAPLAHRVFGAASSRKRGPACAGPWSPDSWRVLHGGTGHAFSRAAAPHARRSPPPLRQRDRSPLLTVATDVSRAFNGGTHCSTHCYTHCYTFDVSEDLVRRERRGSARGRSVCVSVGVAWCRRCAIAARVPLPGAGRRRRRRVLVVKVHAQTVSSVRRSDAVASSEKSIYNRNSSRSLAARYAGRTYTRARA